MKKAGFKIFLLLSLAASACGLSITDAWADTPTFTFIREIAVTSQNDTMFNNGIFGHVLLVKDTWVVIFSATMPGGTHYYAKRYKPNFDFIDSVALTFGDSVVDAAAAVNPFDSHVFLAVSGAGDTSLVLWRFTDTLAYKDSVTLVRNGTGGANGDTEVCNDMFLSILDSRACVGTVIEKLGGGFKGTRLRRIMTASLAGVDTVLLGAPAANPTDTPTNGASLARIGDSVLLFFGLGTGPKDIHVYRYDSAALTNGATLLAKDSANITRNSTRKTYWPQGFAFSETWLFVASVDSGVSDRFHQDRGHIRLTALHKSSAYFTSHDPTDTILVSFIVGDSGAMRPHIAANGDSLVLAFDTLAPTNGNPQVILRIYKVTANNTTTVTVATDTSVNLRAETSVTGIIDTAQIPLDTSSVFKYLTLRNRRWFSTDSVSIGSVSAGSAGCTITTGVPARGDSIMFYVITNSETAYIGIRAPDTTRLSDASETTAAAAVGFSSNETGVRAYRQAVYEVEFRDSGGTAMTDLSSGATGTRYKYILEFRLSDARLNQMVVAGGDTSSLILYSSTAVNSASPTSLGALTYVSASSASNKRIFRSGELTTASAKFLGISSSSGTTVKYPSACVAGRRFAKDGKTLLFLRQIRDAMLKTSWGRSLVSGFYRFQ